MRQPNWIKFILTPFSWLYGSITGIRNTFYDLGILSSTKPHQFTISIGNLTVGGTGKTPMVEYFVKYLLPQASVAILSRGYGRKTKGFVLATDQSDAAQIGDEPLQYDQKFGQKIVVAVCEQRAEGAEKLNTAFPGRNILLLDDAYQHRAIGRDLNILLNDYSRPFYLDLPFPAGRLRETRRGARRADGIIVTKCPENISVEEREKIFTAVKRFSRPEVPVFFAGISYGPVVFHANGSATLKNVKIVTGIANPEPFIRHVSRHFNVIDKIIYPDHHNYTATHLTALIQNLKSDTFVVTTEKDMVKLKPLAQAAGVSDRFAYVPIEVDFGDDKEKFSSWISDNLPQTGQSVR
ncbi:Tetraacyldisaccharide 4'-kinase [Dyadobacter sp. CECT 9275]|uniref:Tetraacyldisaccharide 4'-kinase n=1 Tax=Dyadobacter helix TaxID=2822344 RepID=A0A916JC30_9BACT|nr:tetraacyldisaccharide 4'-kinase [Dyadobacter sp. CECT 9275]CAG4994676.1 Tetraacyldisaccharide 4'-kinase [Dyadobacter sp. CECT 9275]